MPLDNLNYLMHPEIAKQFTSVKVKGANSIVCRIQGMKVTYRRRLDGFRPVYDIIVKIHGKSRVVFGNCNITEEFKTIFLRLWDRAHSLHTEAHDRVLDHADTALGAIKEA